MRLTRYGRKELIIAAISALAIAGAGLAGGAVWIAILAALVWLAVAAFFRDPDRSVTPGPGVFTAPADGLVDDITLLTEGEACTLMGGGPVRRIGIFLSVFDVHVNRAPCGMTVTKDAHRPGRFLDARDGQCSKINEAHSIAGQTDAAWGACPVMVRQISGLVARRIVCEAKPGDHLDAGATYGMIKFGSRTELYLPDIPGITIAVKPGDRATGGITVLARYSGN